MTALCGMAVNFAMLFAARVGTAIGEAGGTPPSHSLISDYFPKTERGRAFAIFALGVPLGTALGNFVAGQAVQGLRLADHVRAGGPPGTARGGPGLRLTIKEPPRGLSDQRRHVASEGGSAGHVRGVARAVAPAGVSSSVPRDGAARGGVVREQRVQRRRSHPLSPDDGDQRGQLAHAALPAIGGLGTFLGGYLSDRLSVRTNDKRWYLWVPAIATLGYACRFNSSRICPRAR